MKAREGRRVRSDWMAVKRERGILISAAVMSFEHEGLAFNLLDTPGHQYFSGDTYRTLTAVDSAVMVLDAAKGIEEQTRKLFEVCRLRDVPIITFVNKRDRAVSGARRDPGLLADRHGARLSRHLLRLRRCPLIVVMCSGARRSRRAGNRQARF
jgi:peptide subunit release factor RF-3